MKSSHLKAIYLMLVIFYPISHFYREECMSVGPHRSITKKIEIETSTPQAIKIMLTVFFNVLSHFKFVGESVPVTKTPLPNPKMSKSHGEDILFNLKEHSKHVLFCGTHILQTRFYGSQQVKAVVLRTGKTQVISPYIQLDN